MRQAEIGRTGVYVSELGFGGGPVGDLFVRLSDDEARATIRAAWKKGVRYLDTSPWYGRGMSERRMGDFVREQAGSSELVLSTKVGRVLHRPTKSSPFVPEFWAGGLEFPHTFDYTYDGVLRSFEDSLQRLGVNQVDLLLIHDLDLAHHEDEQRVAAYIDQLAGGGWRALSELRDEGAVRGIGAGINELGMLDKFLDRFDLDFVLMALCYTLLEHDTLAHELPRCVEEGVSVVVGGAFHSGILATGARSGAKYNYGETPAEYAHRVAKIEQLCARFEVPLAAAALQFPLAHEAVASVLVGMSSPQEVDQNADAFCTAIPGEFWEELRSSGLISANAPTPPALNS